MLLKVFQGFCFSAQECFGSDVKLVIWGIVRAWFMSDLIQHHLTVKLYSEFYYGQPSSLRAKCIGMKSQCQPL